MNTLEFVYWQDEDFYFWLGYLQDYPDYMTQGETLAELQENLRDIYRDLTSGEIPGMAVVGQDLDGGSLGMAPGNW